MAGIIGDLGYASSTCSDLIGLIRKVSESGKLEDFVRFQTELDLAIECRDSLTEEERRIVSETMRKDNYFEDLGTGEYLYEIGAFADYAEESIKNEGYDNKFCDSELLKNIFLEGLYELEDYIKEGAEQANFEAEEREESIREYEHLPKYNPFRRI